MKRITTYFLGFLFLTTTTQLKAQEEEFIWLDPYRDTDERIEALLGAMTLEEKASQLIDVSEGIPRLHIPTYNWWNEALHGVARNGRATVFPQAIGMAATFDKDLLQNIGTAIGAEARAKFLVAQEMDNRSRYAGLTFWSPNVNIFRDPRWGRGQETYGEDPYLSGQMGLHFVKGLQGDHDKYLQAAACAKHYAVHSGPEEDRHVFDAVPSMKDFRETYLPAFKTLVVDGDVEAVMGAYNRVFGEPACGSELLLDDILRKEWGFDGHVVSDCGAILDFYAHHKVYKDGAEATAAAIKAGTDLNCGKVYKESVVAAIDQGLITEKEVDERLTNLLRTRIKLGLLDPKEINPFNNVSSDTVGCHTHRRLAYEAALKSAVLLKNDNNALPLKKDIRTLYVVGPNANNSEVLLGNYFGMSGTMTNILEGIVSKVSLGTSINYKQGILLDRPNVNPIDWSTGEAASADACIAVVGISGLIEGEEGEAIASDAKGDRNNIKLPQNQIDYLKKIKSKSKNPLIVIITGGSPMNLMDIVDVADAILFAWYPGQEGGEAIADIVFGNESPSGKLPLTFPKSLDQLPAYDDYTMEGRTYRYMDVDPLYPFGYGLTYTQFDYSDIKFNKDKIKSKEDLVATVTVTNKGTVEAEEVVQLYLSDYEVKFGAPNHSLKDFQRVRLAPGQSKEISFTIPQDKRIIFDDEGKEVNPRGKLTVSIGSASPMPRSKELGATLSAKSVTINK
ncbi:glycoside hydrolase family 3 C-terminal domain-containing protein [Flammeovirga yaeyamensis]|uniref:Glycoside hydrolase family 3 C-terminal domain-containing protein n=1 Tax=Flammeovirga yaeyamensis TaxID=367791 RepID=A0AAX1ND03_9BACT|nr:glycoside hydrolase family 3 C-terminal domain-containing protein [Flammeovirga yaeyamensis]MBB3696705.1 beta-glucosidase [Flammeovirga yaeyamensis]NMF33376.1 glycoside hydrolase family 3 protein [Flammeovirga yaeyamensis]QWG05350.1 glycoside hydrolase family 3 C-terminal domain-containing protein [Flammeovirga yaeyamensis]